MKSGCDNQDNSLHVQMRMFPWRWYVLSLPIARDCAQHTASSERKVSKRTWVDSSLLDLSKQTYSIRRRHFLAEARLLVVVIGISKPNRYASTCACVKTTRSSTAAKSTTNRNGAWKGGNNCTCQLLRSVPVSCPTPCVEKVIARTLFITWKENVSETSVVRTQGSKRVTRDRKGCNQLASNRQPFKLSGHSHEQGKVSANNTKWK